MLAPENGQTEHIHSYMSEGSGLRGENNLKNCPQTQIFTFYCIFMQLPSQNLKASTFLGPSKGGGFRRIPPCPDTYAYIHCIRKLREKNPPNRSGPNKSKSTSNKFEGTAPASLSLSRAPWTRWCTRRTRWAWSSSPNGWVHGEHAINEDSIGPLPPYQLSFLLLLRNKKV